MFLLNVQALPSDEPAIRILIGQSQRNMAAKNAIEAHEDALNPRFGTFIHQAATTPVIEDKVNAITDPYRPVSRSMMDNAAPK